MFAVVATIIAGAIIAIAGYLVVIPEAREQERKKAALKSNQ